MLYRLTEVETDGEETQTCTRLVADERTDTSYENWSQTCMSVTSKDEVTLTELLQAMESEMEFENRHRESHLPALIVRHISNVAGEEVAKSVLWNMVGEKGLMLGL